MSQRSQRLQGIGAGLGVVLLDIWPLLLIWRAGASGSVGDLSEVRFLGVGLLYAVGLGVLAGRAMVAALRRAAASDRLGRLDPWGAYALGIGVYNLALTASLGLLWGLLLGDENQSLRDREWLVIVLWLAGRVGSAALAFAAARGLLGRDLRQPVDAC